LQKPDDTNKKLSKGMWKTFGRSSSNVKRRSAKKHHSVAGILYVTNYQLVFMPVCDELLYDSEQLLRKGAGF
jgi:hypothetical protein